MSSRLRRLSSQPVNPRVLTKPPSVCLHAAAPPPPLSTIASTRASYLATTASRTAKTKDCVVDDVPRVCPTPSTSPKTHISGKNKTSRRAPTPATVIASRSALSMPIDCIERPKANIKKKQTAACSVMANRVDYSSKNASTGLSSSSRSPSLYNGAKTSSPSTDSSTHERAQHSFYPTSTRGSAAYRRGGVDTSATYTSPGHRAERPRSRSPTTPTARQRFGKRETLISPAVRVSKHFAPKPLPELVRKPLMDSHDSPAHHKESHSSQIWSPKHRRVTPSTWKTSHGIANANPYTRIPQPSMSKSPDAQSDSSTTLPAASPVDRRSPNASSSRIPRWSGRSFSASSIESAEILTAVAMPMRRFVGKAKLVDIPPRRQQHAYSRASSPGATMGTSAADMSEVTTPIESTPCAMFDHHPLVAEQHASSHSEAIVDLGSLASRPKVQRLRVETPLPALPTSDAEDLAGSTKQAESFGHGPRGRIAVKQKRQAEPASAPTRQAVLDRLSSLLRRKRSNVSQTYITTKAGNNSSPTVHTPPASEATRLSAVESQASDMVASFMDVAAHEIDLARKAQLLSLARVLSQTLMSTREANVAALTAETAATNARGHHAMSMMGLDAMCKIAQGVLEESK